MRYNYKEVKPQIFTEDGSVMFTKIRDNVHNLIKKAGCVRADKAWSVVSGDTWQMLACLDRLVELGEIVEVSDDNVMGQHRIFISNRE